MALERDPNDRFETAAQLASSLRSSFDQPTEVSDSRGRSRLVLVATFVALLALVAIWTGAIVPNHRRGVSPAAASSQSTTKAIQPLSIEQLRITHRGRDADGEPLFASNLFEERFAHVNDDVQLDITLSEPAYCILFAVNPDGSTQLCSPSEADVVPQKQDRIAFPEDRSLAFGLTDGAGYQLFCLVASQKPLSDYVTWKSENLPADLTSWTEKLSGNWSYLAGLVVPQKFANEVAIRDRGNVRAVDQPEALVEFLDSLRAQDGVDAAAVLFEVKPRIQ